MTFYQRVQKICEDNEIQLLTKEDSFLKFPYMLYNKAYKETITFFG